MGTARSVAGSPRSPRSLSVSHLIAHQAEPWDGTGGVSELVIGLAADDERLDDLIGLRKVSSHPADVSPDLTNDTVCRATPRELHDKHGSRGVYAQQAEAV
jgi:hypothetical protein